MLVVYDRWCVGFDYYIFIEMWGGHGAVWENNSVLEVGARVITLNKI